MNTTDDLELALRRLPHVHAVGFTERDDLLFVQVHTEPSLADPGLALQVTRIASRHVKVPVAVEVVRWRDRTPDGDAAPTNDGATQEPQSAAVDLTSAGEEDDRAFREARVKLLAVLRFPDTDEIEVHLTLGGQRTIGRAAGNRGLMAAIDATMDALRGFVTDLAFTPTWARELDPPDGASHLVAVGLTDGRTLRHGIAAGSTDMEAAARATLDALNRTVAPDLAAST